MFLSPFVTTALDTFRVSVSGETIRLDNTSVSDGEDHHADMDILRAGKPDDVVSTGLYYVLIYQEIVLLCTKKLVWLAQRCQLWRRQRFLNCTVSE